MKKENDERFYSPTFTVFVETRDREVTYSLHTRLLLDW